MDALLQYLRRLLALFRREAKSRLWVTIERGGERVARLPSESGTVRWGPKPGAEFVYPIEGVGGVEALFVSRPGGARLMVREGMRGEIRAGDTRLSLADLEPWGLLRGRGSHRGLDLTPVMTGRIDYRGHVILFEHGAAPVRAPREEAPPIPKRFRRNLLQRQDREFAFIAWGVYTFLSLAILFLVTRPYPKEVETTEGTQRFAKLIYDAPQEQTKVHKELKKKAEAERKAAAERRSAEPEKFALVQPVDAQPQKSKNAETKTRAPETRREAAGAVANVEARTGVGAGDSGGSGGGGGGGGGSGSGGGGGGEGDGGGGIGGGGGAGGPGGGPGWAGPMARAEELRKTVSGKGLLGVLGGRGGASRARAGGAVFRGSGPSDLDKVLDRVDGLRMAPGTPGGGGGGGTGGGWGGPGWGPGQGAGGGGRGVARGIDDAATRVAAGSRTTQLQERKDEAVQAKESNEPVDSFSLKEATAAINRAVASYTGGLRYLYNKELRKNPDLEGKMTVSITIAPAGTVADAHIVESTLKAPDLEKAIVDRIRKWTFPPVAKKPITVTYPFVFFPTM